MLPSQQCIVFDLDGTLAPSKDALSPRMAELLMKLLVKRSVAIISGGSFEQFETQLLSCLDTENDVFQKMLLLPTSGAALYRWDAGQWREVYREMLSADEIQKITDAITSATAASGFPVPQTLYGEPIENRGTQVTFSWFGQHAPLEVKQSWDSDQSKRKALVAILAPLLSEFTVRIGGMTSIDITKEGIDKAYGIRKTAELLSLGLDSILYVGDALFEGGNDYAAIRLGVATVRVDSPEDTEAVIASWVS